MGISARLLAGLAGATLLMTSIAAPAEVLFDDGEIRVQELHFQPGGVGPDMVRPFRVIRVIEGGTMRRTFPDGRRDDIHYKTGETRVFEREGPFAIQNVGKTNIVLFVVALKAR